MSRTVTRIANGDRAPLMFRRDGANAWLAQHHQSGFISTIVIEPNAATILAALLTAPDIFPPSYAAAEKEQAGGVRPSPSQRSAPPPSPGAGG